MDTTGATSPEVPANPAFVICDSDALVQLFIADEVLPLRELHRRYEIQPVIVEAVDVELQSPKGSRLKSLAPSYRPRFEKAKHNGTLVVLDSSALSRMAGLGAGAIYDQINIIGSRYHRRVDYGEAFSHAAGSVLKVPVLTHDAKARRILERDGQILGSPLLRAFDLFTLFHQCGQLSSRRCDEIRQELRRAEEWLPDAFYRRSFEDGLPYLYPRLLDSELPPLGSADPVEDGDVRLLLRREQSPTQGVTQGDRASSAFNDSR